MKVMENNFPIYFLVFKNNSLFLKIREIIFLSNFLKYLYIVVTRLYYLDSIPKYMPQMVDWPILLSFYGPPGLFGGRNF